jgi:putative SOS response-associated peptidase YedK
MCGRFSLRAPPDELASHFELKSVPDWDPRYNLAPTQEIPIVREQDGARSWGLARWGLIPAGAPGPRSGPLMINARSESVGERAAFRVAFEHSRCIVPADGFYEWKKLERRKQPYLIERPGSGLFGFAGLWSRWQGEAGEEVVSCTILTTTPNDLLAPLHDRMPVILPPHAYLTWLTAPKGVSDLHGLLRPYASDRLRLFPVSTAVNSVDVDGPECVRPAPEPIELDLFRDP